MWMHKIETSFTETEFKRVDDNNEKLESVNYVKQYKEKSIYLCNVRLALPFVQKQITLQKRHTIRGVLNVCVNGVIQRKRVVYVTRCLNDNISQMVNGCV